MTDEELVIYLRRSAVSYSHPFWKAADRIEAMEAMLYQMIDDPEYWTPYARAMLKGDDHE